MTFTNKEIKGLKLDCYDEWIITDYPYCNVCVFPGESIMKKLFGWFGVTKEDYLDGDGYFDCYVTIDALHRTVINMCFIWSEDDRPNELDVAITVPIEQKSIFGAILASAPQNFETFLNEVIVKGKER